MHINKFIIASLCVFFCGCAGTEKKKTTPERKDVNAEGEKKKEKKQGYEEAWKLICHAEKHAAIEEGAGHQERATAVAEWITDNVTNKKARYWWIAFGSLKKKEREGFFKRDAKAAGVDPCPLADLLFSSAPHSAPTSAPAR